QLNDQGLGQHLKLVNEFPHCGGFLDIVVLDKRTQTLFCIEIMGPSHFSIHKTNEFNPKTKYKLKQLEEDGFEVAYFKLPASGWEKDNQQVKTSVREFLNAWLERHNLKLDAKVGIKEEVKEVKANKHPTAANVASSLSAVGCLFAFTSLT